MHETKFDGSRWGSEEERKRWLAELERIGTEGVRARVFHTKDAGSGGSIKGVGTELSITKGFAEEWLQWKANRRERREGDARNRQIFWTRWAAIAATVAATAAAVGWLLTLFWKGQ
jgi:hypothetical protein